jgi:predicted ATP-dependent protease
MIEKKVNLNLLIAFDRVSKQNIHPCLKSRIVGYCYSVNMDDNGTKVFDASYDA